MQLATLTHYENSPMQYTDNFFSCKNGKFYWKKIDILNIFAQNIDCGYRLELPRQGGSNEYPLSLLGIKNKNVAIPQFHNIKLGFKGVYFAWTYFSDVLVHGCHL